MHTINVIGVDDVPLSFIPCPIVSLSLMLDDGKIRCGGNFSSNELLTETSASSSLNFKAMI